MPEIIRSPLTGKNYNLAKCVRIINLRQAIYYIQFGVMPVDIYVSKDFNTNSPILVFLFLKEETQKLYERWIAQKPNKEDE